MVRRRRSCLKCKSRFSTLERLDRKELTVEKRDGSTEPFDQAKIRGGIAKAFIKRPVIDGVVDSLVERVVQEILDLGKRTVSTQQIGQTVLNYLKEVDEVAWLRFASVCNKYENIGNFVQEIDSYKKSS